MSKVDASELLVSRNPTELAVVVIDVQTGLFNTDPPPHESTEVIHRINFVTGRARATGVRVFMVQHDGPPDGNWLVPFSDDWKLHPDLQRVSGDVGIRKTTGDAFYGTDLERQLRSAGVKSLVLAGYATEFCFDSTLRNATSKGFEVIVLADAHTTNDAPMLKAAVIRQYFNWVWSESSSGGGIRLINSAEVRFGELAVR